MLPLHAASQKNLSTLSSPNPKAFTLHPLRALALCHSRSLPFMPPLPAPSPSRRRCAIPLVRPAPSHLTRAHPHPACSLPSRSLPSCSRSLQPAPARARCRPRRPPSNQPTPIRRSCRRRAPIRFASLCASCAALYDALVSKHGGASGDALRLACRPLPTSRSCASTTELRVAHHRAARPSELRVQELAACGASCVGC
jgi:hypothetical protein